MLTPVSPTNLLVNISSMRGRQALSQADSSLAISIRNLSSGVRIHTAKDDPLGFIASMAIKNDIVRMSQAVTNGQRNTSLIATVDSALSQVNGLLNDLRGLVTQAASTGTETPETLAALQMQTDAIIETINLISATTSFQGQKLLDGSLDFNTYGLDSSQVSQVNIYQANFLGRIEKDIVVQIHEPARLAELYYPYGTLKTDTSFTIGGTGGYMAFTFDRDATVQQIADAVNIFSDSTGVGATVFAKSNPGSIVLTSSGKDNDVLVTASEPGTAAGNFVFRYTAPREGNEELRLNVAEGDGNNPTIVEVVLQTQPGGDVLTTAEQIVTLLNTSPLLKNLDGTGRITAALPSGSTGRETVTPFAEVGYYGSINDNNYLQFLAPAGSPAIKFASTPGTPLSVDDTTYPPVYTNAVAQVQGFEPGTSFTLRSLIPGPEGDEVSIIFRDSAPESAEYDPISKSLVFSIDFSGRAETPNRQEFSMTDLQQMIADDSELSTQFSILPHASYPFDAPPLFNSEAYIGIDAQLGKTSGGTVSPGYLVVHLETDEHGIIKTTANDLVKFFNEPATEESLAVLERWGISVANIDPSNVNLTACTIGQAGFGTGLLSPTFDITGPCPPDGHPDVYFTSHGNDVREGFATATIMSEGGRNADWTITAKNAGAAYNNVSVRVLTEAWIDEETGPMAVYDPVLKQLTISISNREPTTAAEIVDLINDDPALNILFAASLPVHSDGQGQVSAADRAILSGGILPIDTRAEGSITASGGVHSTFNVQSNRSDGQFNNTEIRVVADLTGPRVSYDWQAKQLTVGIPPGAPPTAEEVVNLINATPEVAELFSASLPPFVEGTSIIPNGSGLVQVGDFGILQVKTGGATMGAAMIGATDNESLGVVFHSIEYGSQEFVELWATHGELPVVDRFSVQTEKNFGTDILASINGRQAIGDGRTAKSATSDLDIAITTNHSAQAGDVFGFRIDGGGALMQLGPKATWSQQIRIGIQSIHTTALGGESGTLSQLRSDGEFNLLTNTHQAFKIIGEAEVQITSLRGRLGAIQRSQIETTMDNMRDASTIGSETRSQIADADFAVESSNLSRQQLLFQASVSVLQQSGQTRQMLLSLLQS